MEREKFSSRFGILVAMSGSAVGLGNIWRFPYLVGENGGSAFILFYILFVILISLPILFSEFIVGRRSKANAFRAFATLSGNPKWGYFAIFVLLAPMIILSYYSVVGGWSVAYFLKSFSSSFQDAGSMDVLGEEFSGFITSPYGPLLAHTVFLILSAVIVLKGVKGGIERFAKYMMPLLFVIVILIAIRSLTLPGASAGVSYLLKPSFEGVDIPQMLMSALGQSFFSLSLGCGTMLTYASYIDSKENITFSASMTAFADLGFALIAGLAIMPAVFSFGLNPSEGPALVFQTLPYIFSQMPLGKLLAILFFLALLVAALTSSISMVEVIVAYLVEEKHFTRRGAVILICLIAWVLGVFCSLSFGPISDFHIFGQTIFDFCDKLSSDFLLTLGSLITVFFVGWKMKKAEVFDELSNSGDHHVTFFHRMVYVFIKYLAPIAIATIFVNNIIR